MFFFQIPPVFLLGPSFTVLQLKGNQIKSLNVTWLENLTSLKLLSLSENNIGYLMSLAGEFNFFSQMKKQILCSSFLQKRKQGVENKRLLPSGLGFQNFQQLLMRKNSLTKLEQGWCYDLDKLKKVTFDSNNLTQVIMFCLNHFPPISNGLKCECPLC